MYDKKIKYVYRKSSSACNAPLFVFLHGFSEGGGSSQRVLKHGPLSKSCRRMWKHDITIVYPICPYRFYWWDIDSIKAFIDYLLIHLQCDHINVSIGGVSMGAYATWSIISLYPSFFECGIPVSGGSNPLSRLSSYIKWKEFDVSRLKLTNTRIWAFHGRLDMIVPISETRRNLDSIQQSKLTVYNLGHQSTLRRAFMEPGLAEWLSS